LVSWWFNTWSGFVKDVVRAETAPLDMHMTRTDRRAV
jgi:hypothetical protein